MQEDGCRREDFEVGAFEKLSKTVKSKSGF